MFYVRQKVVCVDDSSRLLGKRLGDLARGTVYEVRWTGFYRDKPCIRLSGIVRPFASDPVEEDTPFRATRFRPIQERKTDISVFTEILRKHSLPADQRKFETASAVWS